MSKNIAKSPEMLQKEARIEELKQALKKSLTTLKRLKTRLANTKQEVSDLQMQVQTEVIRRMEEMNNLRLEIVELANKLKKLKSLSKSDREQLTLMAQQFAEESLGEDFEAYQEKKAKAERGEFDFDENARARMRDMFQEFEVEPDEKEQRNIRKVFIKLSQKFHPDRAKDKQEAEAFHKLQQEINEAYKSGDIHKLLEIEKLHIGVEVLDYSRKAVTVDVLQQEIERLERELKLIDNQVGRTSGEIKNLRQSGLGEMLTSVNRAEREGDGLSAQAEQMEAALDMIRDIRDAFADTLKLGYLSPKLDEVMMKMMMQQSGMESGFLDDFDFEEEEGNPDINDALMNLFGAEFFEEERTPNKRPKFKVGTSVEIARAIYIKEVPDVSLKGWQGRVTEAYINDAGQKIYDIEFDSQTLKEMTSEYILHCEEEEIRFDELDLPEKEFKKAKARDTKKERTITYREIKHRHIWAELSAKEQKAMYEVMMQKPEAADQENWIIAFNEQLKFPIKVKSRGQLGMFRSGAKMEVVGVGGLDEEDGFLVVVKSTHGTHPYPLYDLKAPTKKAAYAQILDLYYGWQMYQMYT